MGNFLASSVAFVSEISWTEIYVGSNCPAAMTPLFVYMAEYPLRTSSDT